MIHPYTVDVVSRDNDNIAGFSWGFTIWVTLRRTGRYAVGATCYSNEPPTPRFPAAYPLKTGAQVWEAIRELYESLEEYEPPLDLNEARDIVRSLEKHDPTMAAQVWDAAEAELVDEREGAEGAEETITDGGSEGAEKSAAAKVQSLVASADGAAKDSAMRARYARLADQVFLDPFGLRDD